MDKKAILKWTMFVSFVLLLVGGLNYLFIGIFQLDLFGGVFGYDTVAGRLIFSAFGIAAVILAATVVMKSNNSKQPANTQSKKPA